MRAACIILFLLSSFCSPFLSAAPNAKELVALIRAHAGVQAPADTVDTFKTGKPETPVTGIAVCMFATVDVLKQAVAKGCNLIITHEPLYYNHRDELAALSQDPVVREKQAFIDQHHLVVWRFHDTVHAMQPDLILKGLVHTLGWERFQDPKSPFFFNVDRQTFQALQVELRHHFNRHSFQVVGDPEMEITRVCLLPGSAPFELQRKFLAEEGTELLIAGEAKQWETLEYVRDANLLGKRKALLLIGHAVSEEPGMQCTADWLRSFLPKTPVYFIESGASFWSF